MLNCFITKSAMAEVLDEINLNYSQAVPEESVV